MKTLDEHNREQEDLERMIQKEANKAGVACPECGTEMISPSPGMVNATYPPTRWVECPECGYRGVMR